MMTIDNFYQDKLEINKSKFLSFAYPISSEKNCKEYLLDLKNKFSDATHICYGYILSCPKIEKCSDDGEPSGTAGKPILELLKKKKLENVLIAVVRYFGGIKLGAGPLTRAYSNCAKEALKNSKIKELKLFTKICFHISFEQAFNIYLLSSSGLFLLQKRVGNDFEIVCEKQNKDEVLRELAKFDVSKIEIKEVWL